MDEMGVVSRIDELCKARGWSYYRLSKASGIPYSTLNTMLHKSNVPSVPSLVKICDGFGITIARFFSDTDESVMLTSDQRDCLQIWNRLNERNKELARAYMMGLADCQGGRITQTEDALKEQQCDSPLAD